MFIDLCGGGCHCIFPNGLLQKLLAVSCASRRPTIRTFPMSRQTHSLSQRRAVPGRRKRFDTLLAEHKNRTRERERERELHQTHSQQNPSLRDPHPSTHLAAVHDTYPVAHGNGPAPDATKPLPLSKPKFHSPGLPRYVQAPSPVHHFIYS